jgi:glycosyltransferase involved in cell wall biosynthesis
MDQAAADAGLRSTVVPTPRVSVVVSTFNRPERLALLLSALRRQTIPTNTFEVVLVDNGSDPPTGEMIRSELAHGRLTLEAIRHEQTLGPAGGRNSGWRAARAPLVAFTDDDCVPASWWLEQLLDAAAANPGAIVQGRVLPEEHLTERMLLARTVEVSRAGPQYETCNILYPRALLEELDGFDEGFGMRPAGEDTDLAWRAIGAGAVASFAPDAVVYHAVHRLTVRQALVDATRWGACAELFARHPQTRTMLHMRLFWNVWHYLLIRSLLALALPAPIRGVLLRSHLRALRRRAAELGAGAWAVPYLLMYDVVETVSMVRGGIQHRTPLL